MAGQVNIYKGSTFLPPPDGYRGYGFDPYGNPVIIKEDGTYELLSISGSSSNVVANLGVGLLADLPSGPNPNDVYVTTDTLSVYTYEDSAWTISDLEDKQFITDSSSSIKVLYQLINSVLYNLTVISIDATDVNFNPIPGVPSTNVQSAIEDVISATGAISSVNGQTGVVVLDADDIDDTSTTNKFTSQDEIDKLIGIENGAEVNNISDIQASDLTNGGNSPLHYHSTDRDRANHTGTQEASTISDFDTEADSRITLQKGAVNGIAELDASGLVPVSQLPATGGAVDSVNGQTGVVVLDADDIDDASTTNKFTTQTEIDKLSGIEDGAEVNNISDANANDLTDAGDTTLHYHSTDRDRANHTGTQEASTISDFDTEVSNNTDVSNNKDNCYTPLFTPVSISVVSGSPDTITLDCESLIQKVFVTDAISANATLLLSNNSNIRMISHHLVITGTVVITFGGSLNWVSDDPNWDNTGNTYTLEGSSESLFEISIIKITHSSTDYYKIRFSGEQV